MSTRLIQGALIVPVVAAVCAAAPDAPMQAKFLAQTATAHTNVLALESAWLQAACGEKSVERTTLVLDKLLQTKDLQILLLRSPVFGILGRGWTPGLNRSIHDIDVQSFEQEGDAAKGTVRIKAAVVFRFDADSLGQQAMAGLKEVPGTLAMNIRLSGGVVSGEYSLEGATIPTKSEKGQETRNPLRALKGKVTGTMATVSGVPEVDIAGWKPSKADGLDELYEFGRVLERAADAWYQRIRVLEISRRAGTSYVEVAKANVLPCVERPELKLGKGRADGPDAGAAGGAASDDLLDDMGVTKPAAAGKSQGKPGSDAEAKTALGVLEDIVRRTTRMNLLVAEMAKPKESPRFVTDTLNADDPEFHPWYGEKALDGDEGGTNRLPAVFGGDGPQEWHIVNQWRCFGPFPLSPFESFVPALPDIVWTGQENCRAQRDRMPSKYSGSDVFEWQLTNPRGTFGYHKPRFWGSGNFISSPIAPCLSYREYRDSGGQNGHGGMPDSTTYAMCEIQSPRDAELWAAVGVNRQGRLWINDRLVWLGPTVIVKGRQEYTALMRMPLRQGVNRLVLRVDVDGATPDWWMRLCMKGGPYSAAEAKAKAEAVANVRKGFKRNTAVGWRGDGTGVFPGTHPPVAWNQKTKQNVLWAVPMPYLGSSSPAPAPGTNKVFIGLDPHWLVCLDKDTGKELWRGSATVFDLQDEEKRKQGHEVADAWMKAYLEAGSVSLKERGGLFHKIPKWLQYQDYWGEGTGIWAPSKGNTRDERQGASAELVALLDKRDELQKAPDPAAVETELNKVLASISKLQEKEGGDVPGSPQYKDAQAGKAWNEFSRQLRKYCRTDWSSGYWPDYAGWMFPTPVTDGEHVWVKSGMDVAACFDMDGKRIWTTQLNGSDTADHMMTSPCLVDGKLIMQIINTGTNRSRGGVKLLALDSATGAKRWESEPVDDFNWNDATPAVVTLTDGRETMKVIVTPEGSIVRSDDGKVLARDIGVQCLFDSPLVVDNDKVVFGHAGLSLVQFNMKSRDQVGFRRLWAQRGGGHGMLNCGGAIAVDNRIYFTKYTGDPWGLHERGTWSLSPARGVCEGWKTMAAHDLTTSLEVVRVLALRKGGNQYSPASASDKYIYQVDGDHIFQSLSPKAPMDMVVLTREEQPLRLANNPIDRTYGSGIIDGDRMYIRGYYWVTCVGYTGDEGRRYEARVVARNLMDEVLAMRPQETPVKDIRMLDAAPAFENYSYGDARTLFTADSHAPGSTVLVSGHAPCRWWILGPLPVEQAPEALKAIGDTTRPVQGMGKLMLGGQERQWSQLVQGAVQAPGFKSWELDPSNFTDIHRLRRVVNLGVAIKGQGDSVTYLLALFNSESAQTMRFEQTLPGVRAWLDGVELADGDRVKVGKGLCQLVLEVKVKEIPAEGLHLSPRFWTSEDVKTEAADWAAAVKRRMPYFENAVRLAPDSIEAATAKRLVQEVR